MALQSSEQARHPQRWTPGQARAMASKATKQRRKEYRLRERIVSLEERKQLVELARTALQSPVLAGTTAYLAVSAIEAVLRTAHASAATPAGNAVDQKAANAATSGTTHVPWWDALINAFEGALGSFTPIGGMGAQAIGDLPLPGGGTVNGAIGSLFSQIAAGDLAALKTVILIYVASGGNLAGLLQSSGGILSDVLKAAGVAAPVAAP